MAAVYRPLWIIPCTVRVTRVGSASVVGEVVVVVDVLVKVVAVVVVWIVVQINYYHYNKQ